MLENVTLWLSLSVCVIIQGGNKRPGTRRRYINKTIKRGTKIHKKHFVGDEGRTDAEETGCRDHTDTIWQEMKEIVEEIWDNIGLFFPD